MELKKKIVLLSHKITTNTPVYSGTDKVIIKQIKNQSKGDSCNTFNLTFNNHTGTHLDCPFHFSDSGKKICDYKITDLVFERPLLIDIEKKSDIGLNIADLKKIANKFENNDLLLVRTHFEKYRNTAQYIFNNPFILPECFDFIRKKFKTIKALGIDIISISNIANRELGRAAHKMALAHKKPILLIEDMKLSALKKNVKIKRVFVVPYFIEQIDAAPVTVIAELF